VKNRWTGTMALVRGVMARSIGCGSMLYVRGSMSSKTSVAPVRDTQAALSHKMKAAHS
jgi:hypothetical protein